MARPPRTRADRIIDSRLLARAYLALGALEAAAAMTAYAFVLAGAGWRWGTSLSSSSVLYRQATTACLTAIVIAQVANVFAYRSEGRTVSWRGFFDNRLILAGVAVELVVIAAIDYTGWGNAIFGTAPIPWMVWCVPVPFALGLIALDSLIKRGSPRLPTRSASPTPPTSPICPTSASVQHASGGSTVQRLL